MDVLSNVLPRFQPLRMPMRTPITVARIVDVPTRRTVGHIRSWIRSATGTR